MVPTTLRLCRLHLKSTQISLMARSTTATSAVSKEMSILVIGNRTRSKHCSWSAQTYENGGVHVVDVPLGAVLVLLQELLHHEKHPQEHIWVSTTNSKPISLIITPTH